jgi:hypothetical protein
LGEEKEYCSREGKEEFAVELVGKEVMVDVEEELGPELFVGEFGNGERLQRFGCDGKREKLIWTGRLGFVVVWRVEANGVVQTV